MTDSGGPRGELFAVPNWIVWAHRLAAALFFVLYLTAARVHFGLLAASFLLGAAWFGAQAVLVTDVGVQVSRLRGGPRRAPFDAVLAVQADASAWGLRMVDGSQFPLPPVADRDAVISAIRRRVPRVEVNRVVHGGGWLARWKRRGTDPGLG
ncbi:MAG: hypothetical protein AAFZ07_16420 [Actinomycetota bacterium]